MSEEVEPRVVIDGDFSVNASLIRSVLLDFAKKTSFRIKMVDGDCHYIDPFSGSDYDLWIVNYGIFHCSIADIGYVDRAFGYVFTNGSQKIVTLSEYDNPSECVYIFDADGQLAAVVKEKTMYVLFKLTSFPTEFVDKVLKSILDEYLLYLADADGYKKKMTKCLGDRVRNQFISGFRAVYGDCFVVGSAESYETVTKGLKNQISDMIREIKILQNTGRKTKNLQALDQLERLRKMSETGGIQMSFNGVCIPVGQINIEDGGFTYNIGRFIVVLDIIDKKVKCVNTTRDVHTSFHPHVNRHGNPCLGNLSDTISTLLDDLEFEAVVGWMVEFLKAYYEDGVPSTLIRYWPKETKQETGE